METYEQVWYHTLMRDSKGKFMKGYKKLWTEEMRKQHSLRMKGINTWSKGRNISESHKNKIKQNNAKYWLGKERLEMKGNKFAVGHKPKNGFLKGNIPHNLGKFGRESTTWKEIKRNPLRLAIRQLHQYRQWRSSIFKRDNYSCVLCKKGKEVSGKLEADHYPISFATIIQNLKTVEEAISCNELWDINNGRTLCKECHKSTDNYLWKARLIRLY